MPVPFDVFAAPESSNSGAILLEFPESLYTQVTRAAEDKRTFGLDCALAVMEAPKRRSQRHARPLSNRKRLQLLAEHCEQLNDDDAIDPRTYFLAHRFDKPNRSALKICRQVAETLYFVLGDCEEGGEPDPILLNLNVVSVDPAPDSRQLLVTVEPCDADSSNSKISSEQAEAILAKLVQHTPRLRSEIGRSINRKRIPNLKFQLAY